MIRSQAPVSLVKALEEYLNDPNFEQNRIEYKQNMGAADIPAAPGGSSVAGELVLYMWNWNADLCDSEQAEESGAGEKGNGIDIKAGTVAGAGDDAAGRAADGEQVDPGLL